MLTTILSRPQAWGKALFRRLEADFNSFFQSKFNPFYYLGTIPIVLMIVLFITGLYLFMYYSPSTNNAYESVKYMTERTSIGGFVRSVHRYAADLLIIALVLHFLRILVEKKYKGFRILPWATGIILFTFMIFQGLTGYMLPFDSTSNFVMQTTVGLIADLKIFGSDLVRAFALPHLAGKWLVWIILILHFFIPMFILIGFYLHVKRLSRPKLLTKSFLTVGILVIVGLVSILFPVSMNQRADVFSLPFLEEIDYFYLFLARIATDNNHWLIFSGFALSLALLFVLPWLGKKKKIKTANIITDQCTGCNACALDCPYQAITMLNNQDGKSKSAVAEVDKKLCSGCTVCFGSCVYDAISFDGGIYHPPMEYAADQWLAITCKELAAPLKKELNLERSNIQIAEVPCVGQFGPSMLSQVNSKPDGVVLVSCPDYDCQYREGNLWARQRVLSQRKPRFRGAAKEYKIVQLNTNSKSLKNIGQKILALTKQQLLEPITSSFFGAKTISKALRLIAFFIFIIGLLYVGTLLRSGYIPEKNSQAQLNIDFYKLTSQMGCDLNQITKEKVQAAVLRMTGAMKAEQLSEEAKERLNRIARESVRSKVCGRQRSSVKLTIFLDEQKKFFRVYSPRGFQQDGLVHALGKITVPAKSSKITVLLEEITKEGSRISTDFSSDLKPGKIYYIDFSKAKEQFILRSGKA